VSTAPRKRVFLYSNQPLYRVGRSFLAPARNFSDFLAAVCATDPNWRIAIPCAERSAEELSGTKLVEISLPGAQLIEMPFYDAEYKAPAVSLVAARSMARYVREALRQGMEVTVGCPAPNSFLFWCSWLVPRSVRFACFIRGDTVKTVAEIYRGRALYAPAVTLTKLFRWRVRQLMRAGRAQVFTYGATLLRQYPGSPRQRVVVAPLIDEAWIRTDPRQARSVAGGFRVLFVGRLSAEKNILALVEACAAASGTDAEFRLTIAGDGPMRGRIEEHIRMLDVADKVQMAGVIPNGPRLIQAYDEHDLLCLPSRTEATPRVIVEAAARGLPVLATRVGSIEAMFPEAVRFAPGFEAEDLRAAIRACKQDRHAHWLQAQAAIPQAAEFGIGYQARIVAEHLAAGW
jgi:glycosyltransferase involved in cell wall biosynthesis